jgi:hypothetical protein
MSSSNGVDPVKRVVFKVIRNLYEQTRGDESKCVKFDDLYNMSTEDPRPNANDKFDKMDDKLKGEVIMVLKKGFVRFVQDENCEKVCITKLGKDEYEKSPDEVTRQPRSN